MTQDAITSIANIAANLGEIAGIFAGLRLIFGSIILGLCKVGRGKQWVIAGFIVIASALALPGIVSWLGSINMISAMIVGWIFAAPLLVYGLTLWWLPSVMRQQMKSDSGMVSILCLVSFFFVPLWYVALWMAVRGKPAEAYPYCPAVPDILRVLAVKVKESVTPKTTTLGCGQPHDNS